MAKKTDLAAAKARKQKMFLIGAGVLLLAVAAIQGPKLMKHGSTPAAAPAAAAASDATGGTAAAAASAAAAVPAAPTHSFAAAAYVAGVALPGAASSGTVRSGQLTTFTLFADKDPFVQQVGDGSGASQAAGAGATPPSGAPAAAAPSAAGATPPALKPEPIVFATIMLDGKPQQLQLDGKKVDEQFPSESPLFVLAALKKNQAKIGVAGGSFDNGQTVTLKLGKKVTLVDTATGVDYELKLTYTGSSAQVLESFSSAATQPAASAPADGASAAPTATPTATPTPASP